MSYALRSPRTYSSALRREQAAETRRRVLAAASDLFAAQGYFATSLSQIAKAAGVSLDTVQATGAKRDLLLGAFELTFVGVETKDPLGDAAASLRPLAAERELSAFIEVWAEFVVDANARIARLWRAFRAAATGDPSTQALLEPLLQRRQRDYLTFIGMLVERGAHLSIDERQVVAVADEMAYLFDPEGYLHFVDESGWSVARYRAWLVHRLTAMIGSASATDERMQRPGASDE
jgi:AcrR family transcriptional regulator